MNKFILTAFLCLFTAISAFAYSGVVSKFGGHLSAIGKRKSYVTDKA